MKIAEPKVVTAPATTVTLVRQVKQTWPTLPQPGGGATASESERGGPSAPFGRGGGAAPTARRLRRPRCRAVALMRRRVPPAVAPTRCLAERRVAPARHAA